MKIHPISDIHLEMMKTEFNYDPPVGTDVIVLAGDTGVGRAGVEWALKNFDIPVVMICGNHESYGQNWKFPKLYDTLKDMTQGSHVHFLQNEGVQIQDTVFAGCTLWTDFNLNGNQYLSMMAADRMMNDYRKIKYGKSGEMPRRLTPEITVQEHMISMVFLTDLMRSANQTTNKTVIVTHHAPSHLSISKNSNFSDLDPAYASRLENFILDHSPLLWIHGHMHSNNDYQIGDTRVVSNPRGYCFEKNPGFDPEFLVEI